MCQTVHQVAFGREPILRMKGRNGLVLLLLVLGIAVASYLFWTQWQKTEGMPDGLILANGRLEGDRYTLASKFAGRVEELLAREGDDVHKEQVVVRLDDRQTRAKLEQARSALEAAEAQLAAARKKLGILRQQIPLKIDTARADVAHAEAALQAAKSRAHQTRKDAKRYRELTKTGAVDRYAADQAELAWEVARADLATAMAALEQAHKRLAEAELGREEIHAREQEVAAVAAQKRQAAAALDEAQSVLDDLEVKAPVAGTVTTRIVDEGEVVSPGAPLLTVVDLDRLYLKVYVPEKEIGKLRLGLEARIYTDAFPDRPFEARVRYIASRAQFTPKEVQTPDERVKLVYAVKLYLEENPDHRLTPGLPADAVIRWRDGVPWEPPRW